MAKVVREGRDVTLITYSAGVHQGLEIAEELDKDGISVEVVDVRTLVPLDVETIVELGAARPRGPWCCTRRPSGWATARRSPRPSRRRRFWHLDQPVVRIAAKNTPTPTSPPLEDAVIPQPAEIAETLRKVAQGHEAMS